MKRQITAWILAALCPMLCMTGCGADAAYDKTADIPMNAAPEMAADKAADTAGEAEYDGGDDAEAVRGDTAEEAVRGDAMEGALLAAGEAEFAYDAAADAETPMHDGDTAPAAPDDDAEPFRLTAGEWNDNLNWGFFTNLVHTGAVSFPAYGLDPTNRIAVTVTNDGAPLRHQTVSLLFADGASAWEAQTDQSGTAYLFYPSEAQAYTLTLHTDGAADIEIEIPAANDSPQGGSTVQTEYTVETDAAALSYSETEVMFILDTTGSMGDEISYLQMDFAAIAEEFADGGVTFSVNFYKDKGDEYVTRCNPFTTDVKEVQRLLNQEYADGGGDEPEAVAEILQETITNGSWRSDTNKIAFLIFDAPPHDGYETVLLEAICSAAKQGIQLVPVVASNAARETELFGRAAAIMTNSNYVFLTDDSGIGDSHLEPIIGAYDVELLHDIIVRNIRNIAQP